MNWYLKVLKQYADFNGRARRTEYWMFTLFNMIFILVAIVLDNVLGIAIRGVGYGPLYILYALAILVPGLAVAVRRLHDVGKSGWLILLSLIPLIGGIWLLILMVTEGDSDENQYGPNPKTTHADHIKQGDSTRDALLLIIIIWMFISRIHWAIIPELVNDFYSTAAFEVTNKLVGLIWAFIPLGLAFVVKDQSKRTVLLVLGGVYLAYGLYESFTQFLQ